MILVIPFTAIEITLNPYHMWQLVSTVIAFTVVILTTQENGYAWALNILKKVMNFFIYFAGGLYAKCALDLLLIGKSGYGLYRWGYRSNRKAKKDKITTLLPINMLFYTCMALTIWLVLGYALDWAYMTWPKVQGKSPYIDSFHFAGSLINYYLLAHKKREAWIFSLGGQVAYAYLFATGLQPFAFKYVGYTILSIRGFYKWHKAAKANQAKGNIQKKKTT